MKKILIKSELISLTKGKNIIIGENLTTKNAQIFKQAQIRRSEKKIAQVFTVDGLVKLKFIKGPNQHTHTVRSINELDLLILKNQQQLTASEPHSNEHQLANQQPQSTQKNETHLPTTMNTHIADDTNTSRDRTIDLSIETLSDDHQYIQNHTTIETMAQTSHTPMNKDETHGTQHETNTRYKDDNTSTKKPTSNRNMEPRTLSKPSNN